MQGKGFEHQFNGKKLSVSPVDIKRVDLRAINLFLS